MVRSARRLFASPPTTRMRTFCRGVSTALVASGALVTIESSGSPHQRCFASQRQRHPEREPGAGPGFALHATPAACKLGTLPRGDEADVTGDANRLRHDEARAVVADLDPDAAFGLFGDHGDPRRPRVPLHVAQGLAEVLHDDPL